MKTWVYYELRDRRDRVRFQCLSKIDAEFRARALIAKGEAPPTIEEWDRTDSQTPAQVPGRDAA